MRSKGPLFTPRRQLSGPTEYDNRSLGLARVGKSAPLAFQSALKRIASGVSSATVATLPPVGS